MVENLQQLFTVSRQYTLLGNRMKRLRRQLQHSSQGAWTGNLKSCVKWSFEKGKGRTLMMMMPLFFQSRKKYHYFFVMQSQIQCASFSKMTQMKLEIFLSWKLMEFKCSKTGNGSNANIQISWVWNCWNLNVAKLGKLQ